MDKQMEEMRCLCGKVFATIAAGELKLSDGIRLGRWPMLICTCGAEIPGNKGAISQYFTVCSQCGCMVWTEDTADYDQAGDVCKECVARLEREADAWLSRTKRVRVGEDMLYISRSLFDGKGEPWE